MTVADALWAFLTALVVAALLTPLTGVIARVVGALDQPRERGLARHATPRLGGLAILAAVLASSAAWLPQSRATEGILIAAAIIAAVGAIDDVRELPAWAKLVGQIAAGAVAVRAGVSVTHITFRSSARRSSAT